MDAELADGDDVRMVEVGLVLRFAQEALLLRRRSEASLFHALEGNQAVEVAIGGLADAAHAAFREPFEDFKFAERAQWQRRRPRVLERLATRHQLLLLTEEFNQLGREIRMARQQLHGIGP